MKRLLACAAIAAMLGLTVAGFARALDEDEVASKIENAKTAADHEEIARMYEEAAKEARAHAERHRKMGAVYEKSKDVAGLKGARTSLARTMPGHCDRVASNYEAQADDYERMAAAHREAAKEE